MTMIRIGALLFTCMVWLNSFAVEDCSRELILQVPRMDEARVGRIQRQLKCLEGVHFCGYYIEASCLFIRYDPAKMKDPEIIITVIRSLNGKIKVNGVKGYTMYDVIDGKLK